MPVSQRSMVPPARMLLAALGLVIVSGCASYPSSYSQQEAQYVLNNDPATLLQNENLNNFLSQAPAGGVLHLAKSPWGDNVEIIVDEAYLAASGRECRKLQIVEVSSNAGRSGLVCKTPNGWVNQRVVAKISQGRN
ncbi:DVU3141 family protein [Halomonas sp. AOP13-D3-9]